MVKEKVSRTQTVEYVAKILKAKPDTSYADVVKTGKSDGYHIYPLIMGLAKNSLGMGRPNKKAVGRPRGRKPGRPAGSSRGPGRPAGARALTGDLVRGIERMQNDVAAMRSALRDIAKLSARF